MTRSLAERRHQRQRALAKARRLVRLWRVPSEDAEQLAVRLYQNRRMCSCSLCDDSRRALGPTVQERRQPQWIRGGR